MRPSVEQQFDVASFLDVGARDYQEDALKTDFAKDAQFGIAVLADGMGGHAAGDIASKIVVEKAFGVLTKEAQDVQALFHRMNEVLQKAANAANQSVREHTVENPAARGMGATLVATVVLHNLLYWVSVGDSPLFLFRQGKLSQLNEDHSMAPQIDFLVENGMMDPEVGRTHPDRSCMTSVLAGSKFDQMDCPSEPTQLEVGDVVIAASDGIQFLTNVQIEAVLESCDGATAEEIANAIGGALDDLDDPEQDNASFTVIRYLGASVSEDDFEVVFCEDEDASLEPANSDLGMIGDADTAKGSG